MTPLLPEAASEMQAAPVATSGQSIADMTDLSDD